MSVNNDGLKALEKAFKELVASGETQRFMEEVVVAEGLYAVKEARKIAKQEKGLLNTGHYRNNFHAGTAALKYEGPSEHDGSQPRKSGTTYTIDVYNNLDYAGPLEYGFRSHFVPGYWSGNTFVYQKGFPGGMYVGPPGGFVRGHHTLQRAVQRTKDAQTRRLERKVEAFFEARLK